jgi:DNA-directed RNA polymerase specialized sigma24 family protein
MELMKYEGLVKKAAVQAARRCGLQQSMEDIIQEGWVAAVKALRTYNPDKAKLTTHLWSAIYFHIIGYYSQQEQFPALPENLDIAVAGDYEYPLWFSFLDPREQEMVTYTFQTTEKKSGIIRHFAQQWGWPQARRVADSLRQKLMEA